MNDIQMLLNQFQIDLGDEFDEIDIIDVYNMFNMDFNQFARLVSIKYEYDVYDSDGNEM